MTIPDFEIHARLRARELVERSPPDSETTLEGDVALAPDERREGLPRGIRPGHRYEDVLVEKRVIGKIGDR